MELPAEVVSALDALAGAGIESYLVGGSVRDTLLGRQPRDFDVVVLAPLASAQRALPAAIPIQAHTPVLLLAGTPRVEITEGRGGATHIDQDLGRRDFTLNAIAFDGVRARYCDPLDGRADLVARRLVACDPQHGLRDDPVRVLRGVRLCSELGLEVEAATARALERAAWRLARVPGERLREELYRTLALASVRNGLEGLRRVGALASVLPELLRTVGVHQNRHHRDDVYTHTLNVVAALPAEPVLRLAGLLHDVAKPETKGFLGRDGEISFHRHEHQAGDHIERVAQRLRLSRRDRDTVTRLVRHHLLFPERLSSAAAVRRMLRRVGGDILPALLELRRADLVSRGPVPAEWEDCERRIQEMAAEAPRGLQLSIGGKDIMDELGIGPGPEVGRWLARAERRVLQEPTDNERSRLLAWLRVQWEGE